MVVSPSNMLSSTTTLSSLALGICLCFQWSMRFDYWNSLWLRRQTAWIPLLADTHQVCNFGHCNACLYASVFTPVRYRWLQCLPHRTIVRMWWVRAYKPCKLCQACSEYSVAVTCRCVKATPLLHSPPVWKLHKGPCFVFEEQGLT